MRSTLLAILLVFAVAPVLKAFDGPAMVEDLHIPGAVVYGPDGLLYIAEWGAARVCRYTADGKRTLVTDQVGRPSGLAFDGTGVLYIASYDRGVIYTLAPGANEVPRQIAEGFTVPAGLLWADGGLYVANRDAGQIVRLETHDGQWEQRVLANGLVEPVAVLKRTDGSFVVSSLSSSISLVSSQGKISVLCDTVHGSGITMVPDGPEAFFVCVMQEGTVERITMAGQRTVIARGFSTPLGLARRSPRELVAATWGEGAAFVIPF